MDRTAPLQERRVNGADRLKSLRSEAGGEEDRVLLGDAHVEVPLDEAGGKDQAPCRWAWPR